MPYYDRSYEINLGWGEPIGDHRILGGDLLRDMGLGVEGWGLGLRICCRIIGFRVSESCVIAGKGFEGVVVVFLVRMMMFDRSLINLGATNPSLRNTQQTATTAVKSEGSCFFIKLVGMNLLVLK